MKRLIIIAAIAISVCAFYATADAMGDRSKNLGVGGSNDNQHKHTTAEPVKVPEPTTLILLGAGLIGLAAYGRRK
jgi:hypothetical protein